MRKLLLAGLLCAGFLASPVKAQEYKTVMGNQDLNLILGYKMWINNWATWNTGESGRNFVEISKGGVANILNVILRYKQFFTGFGYMFTPEYTFPTYTDKDANNNTPTIGMKAKRDEIDWNVGYMVVPQLGFTAGLKSIQQKIRFSNSLANGGAFGATTTWKWLGPTVGILGSAPVGGGFSIYGNGAGGIMSVSTDPSNTRNDSATYESAELGLAWRAKAVPVSASFGYKFQRLNTKFNAAGYTDKRGLDLTSGYVLGLNVIF